MHGKKKKENKAHIKTAPEFAVNKWQETEVNEKPENWEKYLIKTK